MKSLFKMLIGLALIVGFIGVLFFALWDVIASNPVISILVIGVVITLFRLFKAKSYEKGWERGTREVSRRHRAIFHNERNAARKFHKDAHR